MEYTSYELAKRLNDKGFRAEHGKDWRTHKLGGSHLSNLDVWFDPKCYSKIPAYTFSELWEVLPDVKELTGVGGKTFVSIDAPVATEVHESPAEAAGLLVEWLIDNGHMNG